jgi:glucosyl-3-phosphoglycerate synthase
VVVDAASRDGTSAVAERAGARVLQEAELLPKFGRVLGKGDAMWRALSAMEGEVVCYLDADSEGCSAHFATGLLGPLVCEPGVEFVKAFYRRPFEHGGVALPEGGGRVTGEMAARRELLGRLPFATGYGVEVAMLIDAWKAVGLEGMAQVDLEVHRNRHQPLQALTPMAYTVLATIAQRLQREGRLADLEEAQLESERPPLASARAAGVLGSPES